MENSQNKGKSTLTPQLSKRLSRQQTAALLNVPKVSPGTWLSVPCLSVLNRFKHHFIAIHPLLYIGYNGRKICMVNLWGDISAGQAKKYVTKTWKVVREPSSPQHAALIITRAISRIGETKYHGVTNNCEHYITWCFTGHSISKQIHESAVNGVSSGGAALAGAGIAAVSVPTVAVVGSAEIGSAGVVLSVSAATNTWPLIILGGVIGAIVGYGVPKGMEIYRKRKNRKKLEEKMYKRRNMYTLDMMEEVTEVSDGIHAVVEDDSVNKDDLNELIGALDGVFRILDTHFHRDHEVDVDDEKMDLLNKED